MFRKLLTSCRIITSLVCVITLLSAQIPLYAQTDEVVPKEQAIARIQKHLDTVNASMKAAQTRYNADNCTKAIRAAIARLGVSEKVLSDNQMEVLLSLCRPLSQQVEPFYRRQQYALEAALATINLTDPSYAALYGKLVQAAGGSVKKTYMDYLDSAMAELKKRDQESADNFSRWIEAVALTAREVEKDIVNGNGYYPNSTKLFEKTYHQLGDTVLRRLSEATFWWQPEYAFAKPVAPNPSEPLPTYPFGDFVESPRSIYGVLPVGSRVSMYEGNGLPKPGADALSSEYFLIIGRMLADGNGEYKVESADPAIRYEVVLVKDDSDKNYFLWQEFITQATARLPKGYQNLLAQLETVLVRADFLKGVAGGFKKLTFNGDVLEWLLRRGTAMAELRVVRDLPQREMEPTADLFLFDSFRFELKTADPLNLNEFPVALIQGDKEMEVTGSPLTVKKVSDSPLVYRSEPVFVDRPGAPSAMRASFKHTIALAEGSEFVALTGLDREFATPPSARVRVSLTPARINSESSMLHIGDLKDPASLVVKLGGPHPLALYLREKFSTETRRLMREYDGFSRPSEALQVALVDDLNQALQDPGLFDGRRFARVTLTAEMQKLLAAKPQGGDLLRLNRLLLEAVYPDEIAKGFNSLWKDALREAAQVAGKEVSNWDTLSVEQAGEITKFVWTELGNRKVRVNVGHLAAMLLLRRTFLEQMEVTLATLPENPDDLWLDKWRVAIAPFINDSQFGPGQVGVTRDTIVLDTLLRGKDKIAAGLDVITRTTAGSTLTEIVADARKVSFRLTFDTRFLDKAYEARFAERQTWIQSATREAYSSWRKLIAAALQKANATDPKDVKAMLELTGQGFEPVAGIVKSRLMRLEDQRNPKGVLWRPDILARDFVDSINFLGEEARANRALAAASLVVVLSAASLAFFAPAALLTRIVCAALAVASTVEAGATVNEYLERRDELKFARGAAVVLGNDRVKAAELSQLSEWGVALSVLGAASGLGGEAAAWVLHVRLAKGAAILPKLKENTYRTFQALPKQDKAAVLAFITEAKAIQTDPLRLRTLTPAHRRALEIGGELERKSRLADFFNSLEIAGPAVIAPTASFDHVLDAKGVKALQKRSPLEGMPVKGDKIQGFNVNGEPTEIVVGELLGRGLFAHVYEIPGRPDEVIKIFSKVGSRSAKESVEIAKRVAARLKERGIPQLEITEFRPDAPRPYLIQKKITKDMMLFELEFKQVINSSGQGVTVCTGLKGGKKLTPAMQRGLLRLFKQMSSGNDPLIMEDGHIGNLYFVPRGNRWEVGILDQDRIARWNALSEEPEVFRLLLRMQEAPAVGVYHIFSLLDRTDPTDLIKLTLSQQGRMVWPSADFFMEKVLEFKRYINYNREAKEWESFILDMKIVEEPEFFPNIRQHVDMDFTKSSSRSALDVLPLRYHAGIAPSLPAITQWHRQGG